jgi:hypothetical protein
MQECRYAATWVVTVAFSFFAMLLAVFCVLAAAV